MRPLLKIPLTFILILFSCNYQNAKQNSKPNIILIIGDDHGYPYFGFMGSEIVKTPHMDTLANSGVVFTNGYVPDNHCRPALQSLVTGILPYNYNQKRDSIKQSKRSEDFYLTMSAKSKNDWESNFDYHALQYFQTMPKELSKLGYKSFQSGKWWEYHYKYGGFTHGMTSGWVREKKDGRNWFQQFMGGEGTDIGRVTNEPVFNFIKENKSNPFFIWYAPQLPHYPLMLRINIVNFIWKKDILNLLLNTMPIVPGLMILLVSYLNFLKIMTSMIIHYLFMLMIMDGSKNQSKSFLMIR